MMRWLVVLITAISSVFSGVGAMELTTTLSDLEVRIVGPVDTGSMVAGEPFFDFANNVTAQIRRKVEDSFGSDGGAEVHITFIYTPLFLRGEAINTAEHPQQTRDRKITSPWLALWIEGGAKPIVNAVVTWNEREMLLDQVRLAGADIESTGPLPSLTLTEWQAAVRLYEAKVLLAASPEARSIALEELATAMPPDLFWLLTHTWQSTLAPFEMGAIDDLSGFLKFVGPQYASIVDTLIARGFSDAPAETYTTIHDLARVMDTGRLKVEALH